LPAHTCAPVAVGRAAHQRHGRDVHRHLLRDDAAFHPLTAALRLPQRLVALHLVDAFDHHLGVLRPGPDDAAGLAAVLSRDHEHLIAFSNVKTAHRYNTSGASEMIFMNFFSRSSRATGPKMRVPRGAI